MAVPTITGVSPSSGVTGGGTLVRLTGSGYRLPPAPQATGPVPVASPSVRVFFGGAACAVARVLSSGIIEVLAPIHDLGVVDVRVVNVDQAGAPIPGEDATAIAAFVYARPDINPVPSGESTLSRITRALLQELKRQVTPLVALTTHVDYDDSPDGANVTAIASTPAIVLSGPMITRNHMLDVLSTRSSVVGGGESRVLRDPVTVDAEYTIIGVDDSQRRLHELMTQVVLFLERNISLGLLRDPVDPTSERVWYPIDVPPNGGPRSTTTQNNSSVGTFSAVIIVRGIDIDEAAPEWKSVFALEDVVPIGAVAPTVDAPLAWPVVLGATIGDNGTGEVPINSPGKGPESGTGMLEQIHGGR